MSGWIPPQMATESGRVADADFSNDDRDTGEDHFARAGGKTCKNCGGTIEAGQPARRRGETDWAHDTCPLVTD